MNRDAFFAAVRKTPFGGSLDQRQVDGLNAILDAWFARGGGDRRHLAYILATAYHETAHTMKPIAEYGKGKGRPYGKPGKHGGQIAYGRGYVQLTWDYNYAKADAELGLNGALTGNYELALRPDVAASIMFRGMAEGWFTGKKLSDYISGSKTDYVNARRIINGTDRAALIAGYASAFASAVLTLDQAEPPPPPPDVPVIDAQPEKPSRNPWQAFLDWLAALFKG